uniref:GerAB/ArcD/ProY family transporter n=1 Tax=Agathobacter sp. TaxID=2021311 RepID=UPI003FEE6586
MFSDNNRISTRQIFRLFVFDFIGMSTLVLPGVLAQLNGCDGLFAIVAGGGLSSVYLWYLARVMREMDGELTSYMKKSLSVWLSVVLGVLLLMHCIIEAGYGAYVFADVMKKSLVGEESYTLILVLILLVTAYAIRSGIESRARVYEVLFWILFVPLLIMFVIAANDVDFSYMGPFFTHSVSSVADGGFEVFCYLTPLFLVLFFPAYVKKKSRKKMIASVYAALWFAVIVLLIMYMILLGNFGDRALGTMQYPAVILMSNIHLRGGFFQRLDAFRIAIWYFTLCAVVRGVISFAYKFL